MFRRNTLKNLQRSYNVASYFVSCPIRVNLDSHHYYIDKKLLPKRDRNFTYAQVWNILAFILVFKRFRVQSNLDDFHLTLAWWLGYNLLILALTIPRYFLPEFTDCGNGFVKLFDNIHGKQ